MAYLRETKGLTGARDLYNYSAGTVPGGIQYIIEKQIGGAFLGAFLRAFLRAFLAFLRLFSVFFKIYVFLYNIVVILE